MAGLLTVKEAAQRLKVARATIYLLCAQGRLAHLRVGAGGRGAIRIREDDLLTYIAGALVPHDPLSAPTQRRQS